jgi:hypothetical protein
MRIYGEVLEVKSAGNTLLVELQGKQLRAAEYQPYLAWRIEVPNTSVTCRTYTIGRVITFEVKP